MNCPCESGLKSTDCCLLPDGGWYKNPTPFTPHPPQTGFSHPDCYLFHTKDCSTKMSDEHYVSETVLKAVDDVLKVSGVPWLKPGESKRYQQVAFIEKYYVLATIMRLVKSMQKAVGSLNGLKYSVTPLCHHLNRLPSLTG